MRTFLEKRTLTQPEKKESETAYMTYALEQEGVEMISATV